MFFFFYVFSCECVYVLLSSLTNKGSYIRSSDPIDSIGEL